MFTDRQLIIHNLIEKAAAFTYAVDGQFINEEDFMLANTGIPTDTFNILVSKEKTLENEGKIRQGLAGFLEKKYPFSVWMDAEHLNRDWTSLMEAYDLIEAERNAMMKLEHTLNVEQSVSHQLTITRVNNEKTLLKYLEVFISLFEGSPEHDALQSYFEKFSQIKLRPSVQMFVGMAGDTAVTTGLLIEGKESYGIYDVMKKAEFRGKGCGSEMFQFLLSQTIDKEKPVVLQASDDGKNIYKRFGFVEVGEMIVFEK